MNSESGHDRRKLDGAAVFVSASFHEDGDQGSYPGNAHPLQVTDAVKAVVKAVLSRGGRIVFGGHPSITPLVLEVGREVAPERPTDQPLVWLFQSKAFEGEIPRATERLSNRNWVELTEVPGSSNQIQESLARMRLQMIKETSPQAAIFIGGKRGIEEEWGMFREAFPARPVFPIGSAGGATQFLTEAGLTNPSLRLGAEQRTAYRELISDLQESTSYAFLANRIVDSIADSL